MDVRSCSREACERLMKEHGLLLANVAAIMLGLVLGFGLRPLEVSSDAIMWIGLWGELFIRMVKMFVLPLIVINLILGVSSLDAKSSGRLALFSLLYIVSTQVIACVIGISLGLIVKPGINLAGNRTSQIRVQSSNYGDVFADLLRNLFPDNLIQATFQQVQTVRNTIEVNKTNVNMTKEIVQLTTIQGTNVMGLTLFSILFGVGTVVIGETARPFIMMLKGVNDVVFWLLKLVIWYSPLGIVSLIAAAILKETDLIGAMTSLGWLVLCVVIGCSFHQFVVLHLFYLVAVRKNPFIYTLEILDGMLAGFAPATSVASLPYLFRDLEDKLGIDERVTKFFLPLSITLNRDRSAIFICICATMVTQSFGVQLNAASVCIILVIVTTLTLGLADIPSGSIIILLMLTPVLQVPIIERVGLIMTVEWFNDRWRTQVNVMSHGFGCGIVDGLLRRYLTTKQNQEITEETHDELPTGSV